MKYTGSGLSPFIKDLHQVMSDRINEFAKYMRNEMVKSGDTAQSKSKRQWMYEYKKWLLGDKDELQQKVLEYMIASENDFKNEIGRQNEHNGK